MVATGCAKSPPRYSCSAGLSDTNFFLRPATGRPPASTMTFFSRMENILASTLGSGGNVGSAGSTGSAGSAGWVGVGGGGYGLVIKGGGRGTLWRGVAAGQLPATRERVCQRLRQAWMSTREVHNRRERRCGGAGSGACRRCCLHALT